MYFDQINSALVNTRKVKKVTKNKYIITIILANAKLLNGSVYGE